MAIFAETLTLTRRRKRIADDGTISWHDERAVYRVELVIDERSIMQELGAKAATNKSHRCRYMGGDILVTVTPIAGKAAAE